MRQVSRDYRRGKGEPDDWRQRLAGLLAVGVLEVLQTAVDDGAPAPDAAEPRPGESPGTAGDGG